MSINSTPRAIRLHIGLYGERNTGKSSLINALTNQKIALVSDIAGTTTDPVYKSMEIKGIGPVVFIDTAGFDDEGTLGKLRVEQTEKALQKTDVAIMVFQSTVSAKEEQWYKKLKEKNIPVIAVVNKTDILNNTAEIIADIRAKLNMEAVCVSAKNGVGIDKLREALIRAIPEDFTDASITEGLANKGDTVLLVMPQDIQAPKGRLILPQVQTLRELLDKKCIVTSCTTDMLKNALDAMKAPPKLIITDSQVFKTVYDLKPEQSRLTSFSVLFARFKGDIDYYTSSTEIFEHITEKSKILIAEACTHVPLKEDIGREKLPRMLRKRFGEGLQIDIVSGNDFPKDLSGYDLIIQCGACMFNRKYVMSRIEEAKRQNVPMSNYGVVIAYLNGILNKIDY